MITVALIVMVIGLVLYLAGPALRLHAHIIEAARLAYAVGLLVVLLSLGNKSVLP